jgi:hypothetical protein
VRKKAGGMINSKPKATAKPASKAVTKAKPMPFKKGGVVKKAAGGMVRKGCK